MSEQENENKDLENLIEDISVEQPEETDTPKPVPKGGASKVPLKSPLPNGGSAVKNLKSFLKGDRRY
jgi:hypothetical protein